MALLFPPLPSRLPAPRRRRCQPWHALLISLASLVAACGGGDPSHEPGPTSLTAAPAAAAPTLLSAAVSEPAAASGPVTADAPPAPPAPGTVAGLGLVPQPPVLVDTGESAGGDDRAVLAVGSLAGGGYAVVWAAREPGEPPANWTLRAQTYDAKGQPAGAPAPLETGETVFTPDSVAAAVLPEGRVAVLVTTSENTGGGFILDTVSSMLFNLQGGVESTLRVLDTLSHAIGYPRADHLGGPLAVAAARDGSYLLAWRYKPGSYLGRAPAWRILRMSSLGAPLDWIQHLRRDDLPTYLEPQALRLTPLDEGGWVASIPRVAPGPAWYAQITQIEVPRPLGMPAGQTLAARSFVLDLHRRGSVLFAGLPGQTPEAVDAPYSMRFDAFGHEQPPVPLAAFPQAALALRGGDYVGFWPSSTGGLAGQRFAPSGQPVGEPFPGAGPADASGTGLAGGGMALAWVERTEGPARVLTQRFAEPAAP